MPTTPRSLPNANGHRAEFERLRAQAFDDERDEAAFGDLARKTMRQMREAPETADGAAREMAKQALARNARNALGGPILQQLWGYALSDQPGAGALLSDLAQAQPWKAMGFLGQPASLALGVAIALQRKSPRETLEAGLRLLAQRQAPLEQALAWCVAQRDEVPLIMGLEEGFRALEAFFLRQASGNGLEGASADAPSRNALRL